MFNVAGVILLIASVLIIFALIFTAVRDSMKRKELFITKKSLVYLAPVFVLIYFLHLAALIYNGGQLNFFSFFSLIGSVLAVITTFTVDSGIVSGICAEYPVFYAAFVLAYCAGGISVILSVASFFSPRIRNFFKRLGLLYGGCDIVVGDSPDSLRYATENQRCMLILPYARRARYAELIRAGFVVMYGSIASLSSKLKKAKYHIIFFRDGNMSYSDAVAQFAAVKNKGVDATLSLEAAQTEVKIIKEGLVAEADKKAAAYISCFSRHELIARQFVRQYPITKYIPRDFYNPNFSIKQQKQINVVFIGFGKLNYQLFRMCSMQFQFCTQIGDKLEEKPVHYYIYDHREESLHNEFFSRIVYEFDEAFKDCDFPKPQKICDIAEVKLLDINSVEARKKFRSLATEDSFTYFIISLRSDLEDASYARTVKRLLPEGAHFRIFVRSKNNAEKFSEDGIIFFGEENTVYSHACIVDDELSESARRLNMLYDNIKNPPEWLVNVRKMPLSRQAEALGECLKDPARRESMRLSWEKLPMIEQESNLYHALNMPFKLNLLGFDMVKRESPDDSGVSEEEFNERYINTGRNDGYSDCNFFFLSQSSNVLAFAEHSRWNAMYILNDYTQMKKKDIKAVESVGEDGKNTVTAPHKNTALRQHACITTYYGLRQLIDYKFSILYPDEDINKVSSTDPRLCELYKIYSYDYMDLDRLYSEITAMGYKIVKNDV